MDSFLSLIVCSASKEVERVGWNKVEHTVFCCCLQGARNVDYLLMAKLVAISTLGNPPRLGEQKQLFAGCR